MVLVVVAVLPPAVFVALGAQAVDGGVDAAGAEVAGLGSHLNHSLSGAVRCLADKKNITRVLRQMQGLATLSSKKILRRPQRLSDAGSHREVCRVSGGSHRLSRGLTEPRPDECPRPLDRKSTRLNSSH